MLTRIEIDGFKSFADFSLDLPPFLVILGQNASGKSNLFDAIQLLRRLVSTPSLFDALSGIRGNLTELFRRRDNGVAVERMRFAVEVLLEPTVTDPFGEQVDINHTRLRYELVLEQRGSADGFDRPFVVSESVEPIASGKDNWLRQNRVSAPLRQKFLYKRRTSLLTTDAADPDKPVFKMAQAAHQGRTRQLPAQAAEATVLSSITTAEFPFLYALRKEIESWRFLQLDPASLRTPGTVEQRAEQLEANGANLARVLRRIEQSTHNKYGSALDEIAADLAQIVRGFSGLTVEEDRGKGQWEIYLETRDEGRISARIASDGTLRMLALFAALHDPAYRGLICFEEPENGVFPQRLASLIPLLKSSVTDFSQTSQEAVAAPLAQLIVSSHSPLPLGILEPSDIVVMDWVSRFEAEHRSLGRVSRVRKLLETGELGLFPELDTVSATERHQLPGITVDEARHMLDL